MKSMPQLSYGISRSAIAMTVLYALASAHIAVASECQVIRFKPGATSAKIHGTVQPKDQQCFRFGTGKGQSVRLALQSKSGNVAFTINGVVDNQEQFEFTSRKQTYEFLVYQTLRSVTPDDFTLSLSIK